MLACFGQKIATAQSPAELKKTANQLFEAGRFREAANYFTQYQEKQPGEFGVLEKLGACAFQNGQPDEARRIFNFIIDEKKDGVNPETFYWLARTLHFQQEFGNAIYYYKLFLKTAGERDGLRGNVIDNIKRCVTGLNFPNARPDVLVENLGEAVNSEGDEFAPLPSAKFDNRLYFASARAGNFGGFRNASGIEDSERGIHSSDMFVTELNGGVWAQPDLLGSLLNTPRHEIALDFNENGQVLYFFRGFSQYSGEILTDTASARDEFRANQTPANLPFRPELGDGFPYFFKDTFLVFSSRRAGGEGGLDLWWSVFSKERNDWLPPVNFGPTINTGYDEVSPFLAKDGRTLYFSSNSLASMGGFDVFFAKFDDRAVAWPAAENAGLPINSPGDEVFFRLSKSGAVATFSSDRFGGSGMRDLYSAHFKKERPEQVRVSKPLIFTELSPEMAVLAPDVPAELTGRDSLILPIFYENDRDLIAPANLKRIEGFAVLAKVFPDAKVIVTCHTDDVDPGKFALYAGIKRAEEVGRVLASRGISNTRIQLRSAGAQYPIAKNVINAEPNITGQRLNRRVELTLHLPSTSRPKVGIERPIVGELMGAEGAEFFEEMNHGLAYRVEIASTKQILGGDEVMMFGDLLVESSDEPGKYVWSVGLYKTFEAAAALKKELIGQGFKDAKIIAQINSLRLTRESAKGFLKEWPDLGFWLKGN